MTTLANIIYRSNGLLNLLDSGVAKFIMAPTNQILDKMIATYGKPILATANFEDILRNHFASEFTKTKAEIRSVNGQPIYLDQQSMANRKPETGFVVEGVAILPINNILITSNQKLKLTMIRNAGPFEMMNASTFKAWVQVSGLKGRDLISLCVSNAKINDLCNSQDKAGQTIFDQLLWSEFGQRASSDENARQLYREQHMRPSYYVNSSSLAGVEATLTYNTDDADHRGSLTKIPGLYRQLMPIGQPRMISSFLVLDDYDDVALIKVPEINVLHRLEVDDKVQKISEADIDNNGDIWFATLSYDGVRVMWTINEDTYLLTKIKEDEDVIDIAGPREYLRIVDDQVVTHTGLIIGPVTDQLPKYDLPVNSSSSRRISVIYYPGPDQIGHFMLAHVPGDVEHVRYLINGATFLPADVSINRSAYATLSYGRDINFVLATDGLLYYRIIDAVTGAWPWRNTGVANIVDFAVFNFIGSILVGIVDGAGCYYHFQIGGEDGAIKVMCIGGLVGIESHGEISVFKIQSAN